MKRILPALALAAAIIVFAAVAAFAQSTTGKPFSALSAASNNSTLVYNDRALGKNLTIVNTTNTQFFFKLYDKKSAPTCGTDTPLPAAACQSCRTPFPPLSAGYGESVTMTQGTTRLRTRGSTAVSLLDAGSSFGPRYRILRPEDEAEVERLYQRLKTVGNLDQKNSTDEK